MTAIDLYDCPVRQDEFNADLSGWGGQIPAIVRSADPPGDDLSGNPDYYGSYRWLLEVTFQELNAGSCTKRFTLKDGALVEIEPDADTAQADVALPEVLKKAKGRMGIGVKHLAAALGVERPTVYAWMKGEQQPREKRWERIKALAELADYWADLCDQPLSRKIFTPMESGESVMQMLATDELNVTEIKNSFRVLAASEMDRSARLKAKAAELRERMKKKGKKPLDHGIVERSIRDFTGQ